ncbi:MAG: TerB family tellurite resistance protein [Myxococcota bacterium]
MAKGLLQALRDLLEPADPTAGGRDILAETVARHLVDAEEDERRVVTAIAGLLACVAYADGVYEPGEAATVREELSRMHGLTPRAVDAICQVLDEQIGEVTAVGHQGWVSDLRVLTSEDQRREVLDVLVHLAASAEEFTVKETNYLRTLTTMLGLEQKDYNAAQRTHRDKLQVLK